MEICADDGRKYGVGMVVFSVPISSPADPSYNPYIDYFHLAGRWQSAPMIDEVTMLRWILMFTFSIRILSPADLSYYSRIDSIPVTLI